MRHKTVLKDLLDIPFDWLMLPWAVGMALAQWLTPLAGQRVVKVRGVTQAVSEVSVAAELRERLLLALLVTLVTFVFPAVVRRSARRWHGWQGRGEQFLFDAPFHRDPLFWLGVLLLLSSITNGSQFLPHLEFRSSDYGPGQPLREVFTVGGSYVWTMLGVAIDGVLVLVPVAVAGALRAWYRRLGDPRMPRNRWWAHRRSSRMPGEHVAD